MAIDFNANILTLYAADIAADAAFQSPGTYGLPTGFGSRVLTGGTVTAAGTGYAAGQLLTLSGGTHTTVATLTVLTVGGSGQVLTFAVNNPGVYTVLPSNPVSVTVGSFTFTATWGGVASQRILTMVSLLASYINQCDNAHEAKLLQTVMSRMMAELRFGTPTFSGSTQSANALKAAMHLLANPNAVPTAKAL